MQIKVVNDFYTLFTNIFKGFVNKGIMKEELYAGQYEDLSISLLSINMYGTQEIILLQNFFQIQKHLVHPMEPYTASSNQRRNGHVLSDNAG